MQLMNPLPFLLDSHFFAMVPNENGYRCCVINVLNGTCVETFHLVLNKVTSTLVFIVEFLTSKLGMQHKTNFDTFLWI